MGLTIHYGLTSKTRNAKAVVEKMRQLALDLPFDTVDAEVRHLGPDVCQRPLDDLRPDDTLFSTVLDGCKSVPIPWHRKQSARVNVQPLEMFSFWTVPGPGSEWASFGLARYPAEIEVTYHPKDDDRFIKTIKEGCSTRWQFDWNRWERWLTATAIPVGTHRRSFKRNARSRPGCPVGGIRVFARRSTQVTPTAAASPTSSVAICASSTCSTGLPSCPP